MGKRGLFATPLLGKKGAVLPELSTELGLTALEQGVEQEVETGSVVHLAGVAELVEHDVVLEMGRKQDKEDGETDGAAHAARTPARARRTDRSTKVTETVGLGQLGQTGEQLLTGTKGELAQLSLGVVPGGFATLKHTGETGTQLLDGTKHIAHRRMRRTGDHQRSLTDTESETPGTGINPKGYVPQLGIGAMDFVGEHHWLLSLFLRVKIPTQK